MRPAGPFVGLSPDRTHFVLGGQPFYFSGASCYYCLVRMRGD